MKTSHIVIVALVGLSIFSTEKAFADPPSSRTFTLTTTRQSKNIAKVHRGAYQGVVTLAHAVKVMRSGKEEIWPKGESVAIQAGFSVSSKVEAKSQRLIFSIQMNDRGVDCKPSQGQKLIHSDFKKSPELSFVVEEVAARIVCAMTAQRPSRKKASSISDALLSKAELSLESGAFHLGNLRLNVKSGLVNFKQLALKEKYCGGNLELAFRLEKGSHISSYETRLKVEDGNLLLGAKFSKTDQLALTLQGEKSQIQLRKGVIELSNYLGDAIQHKFSPCALQITAFQFKTAADKSPLLKMTLLSTSRIKWLKPLITTPEREALLKAHKAGKDRMGSRESRRYALVMLNSHLSINGFEVNIEHSDWARKVKLNPKEFEIQLDPGLLENGYEFNLIRGNLKFPPKSLGKHKDVMKLLAGLTVKDSYYKSEFTTAFQIKSLSDKKIECQLSSRCDTEVSALIYSLKVKDGVKYKEKTVVIEWNTVTSDGLKSQVPGRSKIVKTTIAPGVLVDAYSPKALLRFTNNDGQTGEMSLNVSCRTGRLNDVKISSKLKMPPLDYRASKSATPDYVDLKSYASQVNKNIRAQLYFRPLHKTNMRKIFESFQVGECQVSIAPAPENSRSGRENCILLKISNKNFSSTPKAAKASPESKKDK